MTPSDTHRRNGLYRSREGFIFGVLKGFAEWQNLSVFWTRFLFIVVMTFTGFWPAILAYVFAAIFMKPNPVLPFEHEEDKEFYDSYVSSRKLALQRLKKAADTLERRTVRLEAIVLDREADWDRRFNSGD